MIKVSLEGVCCEYLRLLRRNLTVNSAGWFFTSLYANSDPPRTLLRGLASLASAMMTPLTASRALTTVLFPTPFGPMTAVLLRIFSLSEMTWTLDWSILLSLRAANETVCGSLTDLKLAIVISISTIGLLYRGNVTDSGSPSWRRSAETHQDKP